jgi:hypothetical protein
MHVVVDIDGTITKNPAAFHELLSVLILAGHKATILTGGIGETDVHSNDGARIEQLRLLGVGLGYVRLISCIAPTTEAVGVLKAEYCRDNHVDIIIDDASYVHDSVAHISPNTVRLHCL